MPIVAHGKPSNAASKAASLAGPGGAGEVGKNKLKHVLSHDLNVVDIIDGNIPANKYIQVHTSPYTFIRFSGFL